MLKILKYFLLIWLFVSCSMLKDKATSKAHSNIVKTKTTKQTNKTVTYYPDNEILLDALNFTNDTIINKQKENIMLSALLKNGKVKSVKCKAKGKIQISKTVTDTKEDATEETSTVEKTKKVDVKQNRSIYVLVLLALIIIYLIVDKIKR